jgi:hypothetical protein
MQSVSPDSSDNTSHNFRRQFQTAVGGARQDGRDQSIVSEA